MTVSVALPQARLFSGAAAMISLPAASGDMGVTPGHAPTVAQLRPGVVEVRPGEGTAAADDAGKARRWFVSGGWAFVHADSRVDVVAAEGCDVADIDAAEAGRLLNEATAAASGGGKTDLETAEALVAQEVYTEMVAAAAGN